MANGLKDIVAQKACVSFVLKRFVTEGAMAALVAKHVLAAQKFLTSVKHLPSFRDARDKQLESLRKKVAAHTFSVEEAADLVGLLDDGIWGAEVDSLKAALCLKDEGAEKKNAPLQDYLAMPHYLTAATWKSLSEDPRPVALEKLCRHLRALGLRNPTEVTQGMLLCLVFDLEGKMLGSQQWSVTLKEKANVQKYLKLQPSPPHLTVLPHDRMECVPEVMQKAFAAEEPMDCIVSYEDLLLRAKDWPMRATHRFAQGKGRMGPAAPASCDEDQRFLNKMGQVMAGFMKAQGHEDVSLPGLKIFNMGQKAKTKASLPTLALEDRKEEPAAGSVLETKAAPESQPSGEGAVVQTLQALQRELGDRPESNAKMPKAQVKKGGLKKPASSTMLNARASTAASKKSAASKKPATAMRRPAAAASSSRRTDGQSESREERRLRLISIFVPPALQHQYRNGCARCYHRAGCTLSCWKLRGFAMTD